MEVVIKGGIHRQVIVAVDQSGNEDLIFAINDLAFKPGGDLFFFPGGEDLLSIQQHGASLHRGSPRAIDEQPAADQGL
jgi:hypothetical protein